MYYKNTLFKMRMNISMIKIQECKNFVTSDMINQSTTVFPERQMFKC